jgi:small subunit ribosomal protein S1
VKQLSADPSGATGSTDEKSDAKPKAKPKAKDAAPQVPNDGATAGTTNLGALLKAKLDSKK